MMESFHCLVCGEETKSQDSYAPCCITCREVNPSITGHILTIGKHIEALTRYMSIGKSLLTIMDYINWRNNLED